MNHQGEQMKSSLIRSSIRIRIPLNKQSEVLEILKSVCEEIQFESNCVYARLYRGANEVEIIMLEELWTGDQELNRHLQSDAYRRILLAIEMADTPPEIRFDRIIESSGFETIKTARSGCQPNKG
jgi:quinol monooxygenase YgiN